MAIFGYNCPPPPRFSNNRALVIYMRNFIGLGITLCMVSLVACTTPDLLLGDKHLQEGDLDGAVTAYQKAIREDPFNEELNEKLKTTKARAAESHFSKGRKWLKERKIPAALQEIQIAVGLDPQKP